MKTPLAEAVAIVGGQTQLAECLGVSQQRVWWWLHRANGRVPAEYVVAIERATGVSRCRLRPDVFDCAEHAA